MTVYQSPFPKVSQSWRATRIAGWTWAATALTGLAHIPWADRTAVTAAIVGVFEAGYRQLFPAGALSGRAATLLAAYREIAAAAAVEPPAVTAAPAAVPAATEGASHA